MMVQLPASDQLDRTLAIFGVLGSILLTTFVSLRTGKVVYALVGILTLLACITWLVIRGRKSEACRSTLSELHSYLLAAVFFLLLLLSEGVLYTRPILYERPLLFFLLLALSAGLIAVQVLLAEHQSPRLILFQVIVLGLCIAWSELLIFPDLVGVDPWYHNLFTMLILSGHHIPLGNEYSGLPIFHLLVGVTSLLGGLPYKIAVMLSVSLVQVVADCMFLYLIGRRLLSSPRVGLMASLMVVIAGEHIFMSYWSIPNGFAAVFIVGILYLLWGIPAGTRWQVRVALLTPPMAALILTHSMSAMCMAIVLFVASGVYIFCRRFYPETITLEMNPIPLSVPLLFSQGMFGWWYLGTGLVSTLITLISLGFRRDIFDNTPKAMVFIAPNSIPVGEQVFNNLGLFLFFALAFVGIFYLVSTRRDDRFALAAVGVTPLLIGFFSLLVGYAVLYERWWFFSQVLLAIPAGIGVMVICTRLFGRTFPLRAAAILLLISTLTFLMIISPAANIDNHLFSGNTTMTYSLQDSELASMHTVSMYEPGIIKTDVYFSDSMKERGVNVAAFDDNIFSQDLAGLGNDTVLVRKETVARPFQIFSQLLKLDYNLGNRLESIVFSRVYDDGTVQGYRRGI